MFRSMLWRLVVPFALLAAALTGAVGWDAARRAAQASEQRLDARMARAAGLIGRIPGDFDRARLAELKDVLGLELAVLDQLDGAVRHTLPRRASREVHRMLSRPGPRPRQIELAGVRYRVQWVEVQGALIDEAVLLVPEARVLALRDEAQRGIAGATVVAVAVAVVLALVLARGLTAPLSRLVGQARAIAAGDRAGRVDPGRGPREVRELADSVNAMLASLVAAEKSALLGRLAGTIAHEIRNPLTSIKMVVQLRAEGVPPERQDERQDLDVVIGEIERLEAVVGELLTLGKPSPLQRRRVDLREPVEATARLFGPRFAHRGVRLATELPASSCEADADPDRIQQLLTNLLLNALDVAPKGSEVRVGLAREGDAWALSVADAGGGVEDEAALFVPFETTKPHGTGVGLAICRQIAQAHSGDVDYEPVAVGAARGARFTARLPASTSGAEGGS